jgi:hypothetical protein
MTVGLDKSGNMRKALLTQLKRNGMGESPKAEKQGFAMGAAAGAASGALTDVGINDYFMKELAVAMTAGSSTLFVR